ncbi:MAG: tetratricopeptide repeat protein [Chloroflexota bacterium]
MDQQADLQSNNNSGIIIGNVGNDFVGGNQTKVTVDGNNNVVYVNSDANPDQAIPNQLPRQTARHFTGRTADITWIEQHLAPSKTLVVSGPGGMGKTSLSIEAVNRMAVNSPDGQDGRLNQLFPDGIIFHSFYGQPQVDLAFEAIVRAYGQKPDGLPETQARQLLAGKTALIMLDGCEDVKEAEGLQRVVDVLGRCGVLITTRATSQSSLGQHLPLDRLSPAEALHLLQLLSGDEAVSDQIGSTICQQVDHLPLGVDIAGNYLRETGEVAADYLNWLKEEPIEALDHGETQRKSMYRMVSKSVERLDAQGKDILLALGQLAYLPMPVWLLEGVLDKPKRSLNHPLRDLARYGLIVREQGQIRCAHALVHGYGRDIHFSETLDGKMMLDKVWRWLNENLQAWQEEKPPNFANCDAVRGHTLGVLEQLELQEMWEPINRLVWALGPWDGYIALQGHVAENMIALEIGLRACQKSANRRHENAHLNSLGLVYQSVGEVTKAIDYFKQGLVISESMGDRKMEGIRLGNLGSAYRELGRVEEAIEYYERALEIQQEFGDRSGEGAVLGNLGLAYRDLGRVDEALEHDERALLILQEIGNRRREGTQLGHLGHAYRDLGQYDKALDFYQQAGAIAVEIGYIKGYATQLQNMGLLYRYAFGDSEKAKALWLEALSLYEPMKSPYAEDVRRYLADLENE